MIFRMQKSNQVISNHEILAYNGLTSNFKTLLLQTKNVTFAALFKKL